MTTTHGPTCRCSWCRETVNLTPLLEEYEEVAPSGVLAVVGRVLRAFWFELFLALLIGLVIGSMFRYLAWG